MSKLSFKDANEAEKFLQTFHQPGRGFRDIVLEYNKAATVQKYTDCGIIMNYGSPQKIANMLAGLIPDIENAKLLDLAAGTGLVGEALYKRGFHNLDAHDGAEAMIEYCKKSGVYQNLFCCFIGDDYLLPMKDNTYDAIACSGATIENHLPPSTQDEILRVIKPGGYFVNAYRANVYETEVKYANQWRAEAERLEKEGKWSLYGQLLFRNFLETTKGQMDIYQKN